MNACGYISCIKHDFVGFLIYFKPKLVTLPSLTFEINGHRASVVCHCNFVYTNGWNFNNLANHDRIWLHIVDIT